MNIVAIRPLVEHQICGDFIGIEKLENSKMLLLNNGKEVTVFDPDTEKTIPKLFKLDFISKRKEKEFARACEKVCFKTPNGMTYKIENNIIVQIDSKNKRRIIDPESENTKDKSFKYEIYDLVVAGEDENKVFFVGKRSYNEYLNQGLFRSLVIDFE